MTHRIASTTKNTLAIVLALVAITTGVLSLGAGTASAQSMPAVSFNPTEAPAGSTIGVDGSGFQPFEIVEINYGGMTIGIGVADQNGGFSTNSTIDPSMPVGAHPMDFVGDLGSSHDVHYTVTAQPAPTSTPQPKSKAPAGSPAPAPRSAPSAPSTPQAPARSSNPTVIVQAPASNDEAQQAEVDDVDEERTDDEADVNVDEVSDESVESSRTDEQAAQVSDESNTSSTWLLALAAAALLALGLGSAVLLSSRRSSNEESA